MKKENLEVNQITYSLELLKKEVVNSKAKKNIDKIIGNVKKLYDKYRYLALYDFRLQTCNYNKLLEDLKYNNFEKNFRLIFIRIPGMIRSIYQDSNKKNTIFKFIDNLKQKIKENSKDFVYKNVYSLDNYLVLVTKKSSTDTIYSEIKKTKDSYNLNIGIHYEKYEKKFSKANKNLDVCFKNAIKVINNSQ